jgi:hypothetical protein
MLLAWQCQICQDARVSWSSSSKLPVLSAAAAEQCVLTMLLDTSKHVMFATPAACVGQPILLHLIRRVHGHTCSASTLKSRAVRSSLYNMLTAECSSHACVGVVSVSGLWAWCLAWPVFLWAAASNHVAAVTDVIHSLAYALHCDTCMSQSSVAGIFVCCSFVRKVSCRDQGCARGCSFCRCERSCQQWRVFRLHVWALCSASQVCIRGRTMTHVHSGAHWCCIQQILVVLGRLPYCRALQQATRALCDMQRTCAAFRYLCRSNRAVFCVLAHVPPNATYLCLMRLCTRHVHDGHW